MNTLETDDPIKSQLLQKTTQKREELETGMKEFSDRTEKVMTNALIIGGVLALTYFVVRRFSEAGKSKRKIKKVVREVAPHQEAEVVYEAAPSVAATLLSQVGSSIATQATVLLLDLAKEKLSEYLKSQAQKKANEHS
jgi:hypothetical protein